MEIEVRANREYDQGVHPEVTEIRFFRSVAGDFFKDDRFPNLVKLDCSANGLTELNLNCPSLQKLLCHRNQLTILELNCPSLQVLWCNDNQLTKLELNCPSLWKVWCYHNKLTELELNCPSLQELYCRGNQLIDLNGLEFCTKLEIIGCSGSLGGSVKILKYHLPNLIVDFR